MKILSKYRASAMLVMALPAIASASPTGHYVGQNLAKMAKVDMVHATAIAHKARAGLITDRELEREGGGSGLRYSFDIKSGGKTFEVGVDAKTGRVLENKAEGPHPD